MVLRLIIILSLSAKLKVGYWPTDRQMDSDEGWNSDLDELQTLQLWEVDILKMESLFLIQ